MAKRMARRRASSRNAATGNRSANRRSRPETAAETVSFDNAVFTAMGAAAARRGSTTDHQFCSGPGTGAAGLALVPPVVVATGYGKHVTPAGTASR